ncbi:hypothetical protein ACFWGD_01255 [Corynebacterium sp. NPDC060344]|uniref:hypothetical protein n=1 Tax=Corynebacterium sp. NPDC060344 TaxID=3347101 RepID=UPI003646EBBE
MTVLIGRQFRALRASWSTWALAGVAALFAVLSPITARYLPEILGGLVGGDAAIPIDVSALPDPSPADAWAQWSSNLAQLVIVIVAIVAASAVSADVTRGTAVPILAHRVSRPGLWASAFTAVAVTLAVVAAAGTVLMIAVTALLFDGLAVSEIGDPVATSALWLVFALSVVAVTMAASGAGASSLGAAAVGIAYFALMAFAGMWPVMMDWSPAGLLAAKNASAEPGAVIGTVAVIIVGIAAGIASFTRREL